MRRPLSPSDRAAVERAATLLGDVAAALPERGNARLRAALHAQKAELRKLGCSQRAQHATFSPAYHCWECGASGEMMSSAERAAHNDASGVRFDLTDAGRAALAEVGA